MLLCGFSYATAYIFKVDKWQKDNHLIYRFFDNHACQKPSDIAGIQQRNEFLYLVKKYNGIAIIEDIEYVLPQDQELLDDPFAHINTHILPWNDYVGLINLYQQEKFLACLASQCFYTGIPVINIEFRSLISLALCDEPQIKMHYKDHFFISKAVDMHCKVA